MQDDGRRCASPTVSIRQNPCRFVCWYIYAAISIQLQILVWCLNLAPELGVVPELGMVPELKGKDYEVFDPSTRYLEEYNSWM